nr:uncharacterized protein LOC131749708 isoform X1 [Kogia breviceps]
MTLRARGARLLGGLLLFALIAAGAAPFSWDLREPRSRASKIRGHPRGNLWATDTSCSPLPSLPFPIPLLSRQHNWQSFFLALGHPTLLPAVPCPPPHLSAQEKLRSLHGQEESGAPQPIAIGDSSPHLPEGPETAAES